MDDWSLLPRQNAVSEPAPYHQSTLSPTTQLLTQCQTRPAASSATTGAEKPYPRAQRLTRQAEPGNSPMKSGGEPRNPLYDRGSR